MAMLKDLLAQRKQEGMARVASMSAMGTGSELWRKTAATVLPRAREVVQEGAGGAVMARARGESEGRTEVMGRGGALTCPECASARSGTTWASWARDGMSRSTRWRARLWPGMVQARSVKCGRSC
jgi:hypothetical protein